MTINNKAHTKDWLKGRELLRIDGYTDLFLLSTDYLGYIDATNDIHKPLCDVIQSVNPVIIRFAGSRCPLTTTPQGLTYLYNLDVLLYSHYLRKTNALTYNNSHRSAGLVSNNTNTIDNTNTIAKANSTTTLQKQTSGVGGGGSDSGLDRKYISQKKEAIEIIHKEIDGIAYDVSLGEFLPETFKILYNAEIKLKYLVHYDIKDSWFKDYVEDGRELERLFLLFRACFKTTLISIAHTIQLCLLWPDIRILISSHKKDKGSIPILKAIKHHFINNDTFRLIYPDYCPQQNQSGVIEWGTQEKVCLPNRSKSCPWPEDTIEVAGLNTDVAGRHYDYIKNDDMVTKELVSNEEMIAKCKDNKRLQKFLFVNPAWGITDNVGTIYHFNDMHNEAKKSTMTKVILPLFDNKGKSVFPSRFDDEAIAEWRVELGTSYEFSCQMLLNPIALEDQIFRPEWFEFLDFYYDPSELTNLTMRISIYVDPANTRKKKSDFTAIIVVGYASDGKYYLLDIIRDKLKVEARTNLVLDTARKWNQKTVHYEAIAFQETDCHIIRKKARDQNYRLNVIEYKSNRQSKEDRIRGLQPLYERGEIRWPKKLNYYSTYEGRNIDMVPIMKDEGLMFPKTIHDDLWDCHAQMLSDTSIAPKTKTTPQQLGGLEKVKYIVKQMQKPLKFKSWEVPCRLAF